MQSRRHVPHPKAGDVPDGTFTRRGHLRPIMRKFTHIGALPFRLKRGEAEFLLISSRGSGRWIIPKGHWEAHETARAAALRESFEEGGIEGVVGARPLGTFIDRSQRGTAIKLQVYPLQVTRSLETWPEKKIRTRKWVRGLAAIELVSAELAPLIVRFCSRISSQP